MTLTRVDGAVLAELLGLGVAPDATWRSGPDAAETTPWAGFRARYNVAPGDLHPIVRGDRGLGRPVWSRAVFGIAEPTHGRRLLNARSETAARLRTFAPAFRVSEGRCVVLADGFYEWHGPKTARRPVWFHAPDGGWLALAGLLVPPPTGEVSGPLAFAILTRPADDVVGPVHDRMPCVLRWRDVATWLDPSLEATSPRAGARTRRSSLDEARAFDPLAELLTHEASLVATPVSRRVNSPRFDDAACLEPEPEPGHDPDRDRGPLRLPF